MNVLIKCVLVLLTLSSCTHGTTYYNRKVGPFTKFDNPDNVPVDDYIDDGTARGAGIDSNDNFDPDGIEFDITSLNAVIFDTAITTLRVFDVGFAECGTGVLGSFIPLNLPVPTVNGLDLTAGRCIIAPYVVAAANANTYHVAYRIVDSTVPQNQHDTDRISAEVNTALHQYRTKWVAKKAVIISWEQFFGAGVSNSFQAVLAVGETDAGASQTFVLFLYEQLQTPSIVQGHVTGLNNAGTAGLREFARVCSKYASADVTAAAPAVELVENSNYKCGNPGTYVFPVQDASSACKDENTACDSEAKPNCNQTNIPKDSCTETFSCIREDALTTALLTVNLKWYKRSHIHALDFDTYIGGGTMDNPDGEQVLQSFSPPGGTGDICGKDLTDPDTENSVDLYELSLPVAFSSNLICGVNVDTTEGSMGFAFKVYDNTGNTDNLDRDGDLIIYGKCYYDDAPRSVTQSVLFNDFSQPTEMPPRVRSLTLSIIDRPDGDNGQILTIVPLGRGYYLLIAYDPGLPFNAWADPFGAYVDSCYASNNVDFLNDLMSWQRSEEFIFDGCPVDPATLSAVYLTKSFEAQASHVFNPPVAGNIWYQVSGAILAAKWNLFDDAAAEANKVFFKCTVVLCTAEADLAQCSDNCDTDKRKRRSLSDNVNATRETVYTSLTITEPESEPGTERQSCTSYTTTISTMATLMAVLLAAATLCIMLVLKLSSVRSKAKRKAFGNKVPK